MSLLESLAEAHRSAQSDIAAEVVLRTLQQWSVLDINALDATFPGWRDLVEQVINDGRNKSAILAQAYTDIAKKAQLGPDAAAQVTLDTVVDFDQVTGNLIIAGPASIKRALSRGGVTLDQAIQTAQAQSAAVAENLALDGGRNTILSDKQLVYYERVCSGNPCAFCAMLASRGPVYHSKETAGFQPHPSCHCMPMPVFVAGGGNRSAQSKAYSDQWNTLTKGLHGQDAINAFRRGFTPVPVVQESLLGLN